MSMPTLFDELAIPAFLRRTPGDAPGDKRANRARPRPFDHAGAIEKATRKRAATARARRREAEAVKAKAQGVWHGSLPLSEALDALEGIGLNRLRAQAAVERAIEALNRAARS